MVATLSILLLLMELLTIKSAKAILFFIIIIDLKENKNCRIYPQVLKTVNAKTSCTKFLQTKLQNMQQDVISAPNSSYSLLPSFTYSKPPLGFSSFHFLIFLFVLFFIYLFFAFFFSLLYNLRSFLGNPISSKTLRSLSDSPYT